MQTPNLKKLSLPVVLTSTATAALGADAAFIVACLTVLAFYGPEVWHAWGEERQHANRRRRKRVRDRNLGD